MTAICRKSVFGLALLLAAALAAADTVITAEEVIPCSVVSADTNFVRLRLPDGGIRMLETHNVREIRLSDPSRVAAVAAELGHLEATPDSGRHAPLPDVCAEQERRRSVLDDLAEDLRAGRGMDTLPRSTTRAAMVAWCRELRTALLDCSPRDDAVARLSGDVDREAAELRTVPPVACSRGCAAFGGLLGAAVGAGIVYAMDPTYGSPFSDAGVQLGFYTGGFLGVLTGYGGSEILRNRILAHHRKKVNDLVRRFNRIVAAER